MNAHGQPQRKRPICTALSWLAPALLLTAGTLLSDPDLAPLRKLDHHVGNENGVSFFVLCVFAASLLAVVLGIAGWRRGEAWRGFAVLPITLGALLLAYTLLILLLLMRT
jgi:hypothetical protein